MVCVCVGGGEGGELGLCTLVLCTKPSTKPSGPMGIANDPAIFNDSLHISRFLGADLNIIDRKRLRCLTFAQLQLSGDNAIWILLVAHGFFIEMCKMELVTAFFKFQSEVNEKVFHAEPGISDGKLCTCSSQPALLTHPAT